MSFVEGFYSYALEITDPGRDTYAKIRLKIPRHITERADQLQSRMITLVHAYSKELEFTAHPWSESPMLIQRNIVGELERWIDIGVPTKRDLERALRTDAPEYRIYFTSPEEIARFCHLLRGSKTNWVSQIGFFLWDPEFLAALAELTVSSSTWSATILDDQIYLQVNGQALETTVPSIDIWAEFQKTIVGDTN